jgi:mitofusin
LADGFPDKYFEFKEFERKFEECISKSAVRTKFEQHSKSGNLIVSEVRQIIKSLHGQAQKLKTQKAEAKKELDDKLKFTKKQLPILRELTEEKIRQMAKDVEQTVSCLRGNSVTCTEGTQ